MYKITILLTFLSIFLNNSYSQNTDLGWHLVTAGTEVMVIQGNSNDAIKNNNINEIIYSQNEAVFVFMKSDNIYYCFDPEGRLVLFKGAALYKVTVEGRPMMVREKTRINLNQTLSAGNNVWVVGFDPSKKSATILLNDGKTVDILETSLKDFKDYFDSRMLNFTWKKL